METEITDIGKVAITPRKDYKNEQTYEWLDVVTYDGAGYMCIAEDGCTGIVPTNTDCWQLLADKGHFTEEDKEEFKKAVVEESKTEINEHTDNKKTELNNYTTEQEKSLENELDKYKTEKEAEMDLHKATLETEMANKKDSLIEEIETAQDGFDANVEEKTNTFNSNVETKTTEFNNNSNAKTEEFNNNSTEKINAFNSNAEEKIAEYDAHAESVLTETDDLFNALNTEKASGTELYIEDAKPCRIMNTEIGGMYKQETTAGANLLDTSDMLFNNGTLEQNGLTAKINTDGSIVINGTATANTYFRKSIKNILEDGNYYFYNFNNVTQSNSTYYMLIQGNKSTGYGSTDYYNARGYQTDNFIKDIITYDRTFDCMFLFINGFVANNLILYPEISKTKQTVFEPYTGGNPSPNPDYPQAIEQAESVKLMCDSSNLFNITNYNNLNLIRNGNATITKTENNFSFLTTADNYCGIYVTIAKLKEYIDSSNNNTTYNISFDVSATKNTNFWYGTSSVKTTTINTNKTRLSVTGMLTKPLTLYSISQEAGTTITISNIKVTKTEDVEYTPYQNQAINIDLKGNKLCAVSDTIKDKLLIDRSGNVALQKNVGEVIFNGNEHWELAEKGFYNSSYFIGKKDKKNFEACCNYFLVDRLGKTWTGFNHCGFNNSGYFWIQEEHKLATTPEGFNEWLTTHNLEVYYALATPEIIDLGQLTELPKTFNGINNIWAETNLGNTEIEIEYVQDVKKLLEKQNARLDNIEALLSTTETSALLLDNMQNDLESEVE